MSDSVRCFQNCSLKNISEVECELSSHEKLLICLAHLAKAENSPITIEIHIQSSSANEEEEEINRRWAEALGH